MTKFDTTIDNIQASLVWFVISIITVCIAILFLFDVLAGTGTMLFLTNGKEWQSVVISLATTGLLFALMFIGYMMMESKSKVYSSIGKGVMLVAFLIYSVDVIFDSLLADILRYGTIMKNGDIDAIQWAFRGLLGGISTVGDALAIAMVIGMPVLKSIIGKSLGKSEKVEYRNPQRPASNSQILSKLPTAQQTQRPAPRPSYNQPPTVNPVSRVYEHNTRFIIPEDE